MLTQRLCKNRHIFFICQVKYKNFYSLIPYLTKNGVKMSVRYKKTAHFFVILHSNKNSKMGRILAIDYGRKRCGIAVTDILRIAANGLPTIPTHTILQFIKDYCQREPVDEIVVGLPKQLNNNPSESMQYITPFINNLKKLMPEMKVTMYDERFTSTIAHREMLAAGLKKSDRQKKELADELAATIILTDYLQSRQFNICK